MLRREETCDSQSGFGRERATSGGTTEAREAVDVEEEEEEEERADCQRDWMWEMMVGVGEKEGSSSD